MYRYSTKPFDVKLALIEETTRAYTELYLGYAISHHQGVLTLAHAIQHTRTNLVFLKFILRTVDEYERDTRTVEKIFIDLPDIVSSK